LYLRHFVQVSHADHACASTLRLRTQ